MWSSSRAWRDQPHDAIVLDPKMRHEVSLPHLIQVGMRRVRAARVQRSFFDFRPAPQRNQTSLLCPERTVGYNFSEKKSRAGEH